MKIIIIFHINFVAWNKTPIPSVAHDCIAIGIEIQKF